MKYTQTAWQISQMLRCLFKTRLWGRMKDQWESTWLILIGLGAFYKAKHNKLPVSSAVCLHVPVPLALLSISKCLLVQGGVLKRLEALWVRAAGPSFWALCSLAPEPLSLWVFLVFLFSSVTDWYYSYHHIANSTYLEVEESSIFHPCVYLANRNYLNRKWAQATLIYHEKSKLESVREMQWMNSSC